MPEIYTTRKRIGYGSRLKNTIGGIILGPILVIAAIILLWVNEGRNVASLKGIQSIEKNIVSIDVNSQNPENNGKLVHFVSPLETDNIFSDEQFGLSIPGLALRKKVEMFQWKETKKTDTYDNFGGSQDVITKYQYDKVWSESNINSTNFHKREQHTNPTQMPYKSHVFGINSDIRAGKYRLGTDFVTHISPKEQVSLHTYPPTNIPSDASQQGNFIYIGKDIQNPQIGDVRISYTYMPTGGTYSILGMQTNNNIISGYTTENGYEATKILEGTHSAASMIQVFKKENTMFTWGLRAIAITLMFVGFQAFFAIIPMLAKVIPMLSKIIGFGINIISLILTIIISGSVFIIAWLFYRPIIAIITIIIMISIIGLIIFFKKKKKENLISNKQDLIFSE